MFISDIHWNPLIKVDRILLVFINIFLLFFINAFFPPMKISLVKTKVAFKKSLLPKENLNKKVTINQSKN